MKFTSVVNFLDSLTLTVVCFVDSMDALPLLVFVHLIDENMYFHMKLFCLIPSRRDSAHTSFDDALVSCIVAVKTVYVLLSQL